jgi:hypothetical protein
MRVVCCDAGVRLGCGAITRLRKGDPISGSEYVADGYSSLPLQLKMVALGLRLKIAARPKLETMEPCNNDVTIVPATWL